jgi:hypothetical protein
LTALNMTGLRFSIANPMKIILILGVVAGLTLSASAQNFTAPARTQQVQRKKAPPPVRRREVTGVIPRAIRGGNPLQMLNPRAPARYGTAQESVLTVRAYSRRTSIDEPNYPGKWKGIKFFSFLF